MPKYPLFIKIASISVIVCFTGCTTDNTRILPCTPVKIPVYKNCDITIPQSPVYLFDQTTPQDYLTHRVESLMLDRQMSRDYEAALLKALTVCVIPESTATGN